MHARIVSALLTGSLFLSAAGPAFAAQTSDDVQSELDTWKADEICVNNSARTRGRCITDALKRIRTIRKAFSDALNEERKEWYDEHAHLGVSAEYRKALQEYTKEVLAKRRAFNARLREIEKTFFDLQKKVRTSGASSSSSSSRRPARGNLRSAEAACSAQRSAAAKRVCIRFQLRSADPAARLPAVRSDSSSSAARN